MREQRVATRVNRRTERAGVLSREMHVIVIAHVRHDLTAQRAPPPLVGVTLSLKYLRYPPIFQLCNNRNHRVSASLTKMRRRVISLFLAFSFLSLSLFFFVFFLFFFVFSLRFEFRFCFAFSPPPACARVRVRLHVNSQEVNTVLFISLRSYLQFLIFVGATLFTR